MKDKEKFIESLKRISIIIFVFIIILIQGLLFDYWDKDYASWKEFVFICIIGFEWIFITIGIYRVFFEKEIREEKQDENS